MARVEGINGQEDAQIKQKYKAQIAREYLVIETIQIHKENN